MSISGSFLPRCGETLWIHYLSFVNLIFTVASLVETVVCMHVCFGGIGTTLEVQAEEIDYWARRVLPSLFAIGIAYVYALEPIDPYAINSTNGTVSRDNVLFAQPMYSGFAPHHHVNVPLMVVAPFAVGLLALLTLIPRYRATKTRATTTSDSDGKSSAIAATVVVSSSSSTQASTETFAVEMTTSATPGK